ncbi:MAG: OmpA family protein [Pseudomonadota bacterium]
MNTPPNPNPAGQGWRGFVFATFMVLITPSIMAQEIITPRSPAPARAPFEIDYTALRDVALSAGPGSVIRPEGDVLTRTEASAPAANASAASAATTVRPPAPQTQQAPQTARVAPAVTPAATPEPELTGGADVSGTTTDTTMDTVTDTVMDMGEEPPRQPAPSATVATTTAPAEPTEPAAPPEPLVTEVAREPSQEAEQEIEPIAEQMAEQETEQDSARALVNDIVRAEQTPPDQTASPSAQLARAPAPSAPSVDVIKTARGDDLYRIVFPQDSAELDQNSVDLLTHIARELTAAPDVRATINAYAALSSDSQLARVSRRLSLTRALEVRTRLIESGVGAAQISLRAFTVPTDDEIGARVDVTIPQ